MINIEQYALGNGTYRSPKNQKIFGSEKAIRAHLSYAGHMTADTFAKRTFATNCTYCNRELNSSSIKKHESACYLNPKNTKNCQVCASPIKNYKVSKGTCSYSCSNTLFRSGENNGSWKGNNYNIICFNTHPKKCSICDEVEVIDVHHLDFNHENNNPTNLIPLCPTHHAYIHRGKGHLVKHLLDEYIEKYNN